ncbi:MAG: Glycosyl transferase, group 1 [Candidatus Magasanikbacteria bacterium GW2011_GWC2_40_17]|uniref:Glycosyl transferase, group 1 n=1 Tax=Candidatus Magasanikbacteria bacterium GW2011_GWA2_42_32 TaxID=1619039 RepID=A0A0G1A8N8_9BACT|nr:MAG: Glycosyl transferase, group 1 [Candidatus Magasanikbacteria bacterium GW2011_GWC2_40_17]KKS57400.1 MAG: Glycosyl transferase, group 1 [Candidatus Magasanikbacteria bacterium GW2011_GWA2_42_32]
MKVLLVNYEFPPLGGGGGRVSYQIIKKLSQRVQFDVLTSHYPGKNIYPEKIDNVRIYSVPSHRQSIHHAGFFGMLSFLINSLGQFRDLIKKNNYDLIHYYFSVPTGLLSFFQPKRIPYIISLNGGDVPGYNPEEMPCLHKVISFLNKRVVKGATAVTAVSEDLGMFVKKKMEIKSVQVIYNGIEEKRVVKPSQPRSSGSKLKLICISRLIFCKRIDLIILAIKDLDDVELEIIGDGYYKDKLISLIKKNNLTDRVKLLGYINNADLDQYLKAADIFILPSIGDSFGIVFLEAMACGLPIIAAKAGGVAEVVKNGFNGLLAEPNDLDSLKKAIIELKNNPDERVKFGLNSLARVKEFNWEEIAEQYFKLYKKVLPEEKYEQNR